jgi:hypothetical protein
MSLKVNWTGPLADPGASSSTITVNVPSGQSIAVGDLLLVYINDGGSSKLTISTPTGWSAMPGIPPSSTPNGIWTYGFYKFATSSDVGVTSYTFTASPNFSYAASALVDISGAASNPFDFNQLQSTAGDSVTFSSVTTTAADLLLIFAGGYYNYTTNFPSGWTVLENYASSDTDWGAASLQQSKAGATGSVTVSSSNALQQYFTAYMVGILPAPTAIQLAASVTDSHIAVAATGVPTLASSITEQTTALSSVLTKWAPVHNTSASLSAGMQSMLTEKLLAYSALTGAGTSQVAGQGGLEAQAYAQVVSAALAQISQSVSASAGAALVEQVIALAGALAASFGMAAEVEAESAALASLLASLTQQIETLSIATVSLYATSGGTTQALLSSALTAQTTMPGAAQSQLNSTLTTQTAVPASSVAQATVRLAVAPSMNGVETTLLGLFAALALNAVIDMELGVSLIALLEESGAIFAAAAEAIRVSVAIILAAPLARAVVIAAPLWRALVLSAPLLSAITTAAPLARTLVLSAPLSPALVVAGGL